MTTRGVAALALATAMCASCSLILDFPTVSQKGGGGHGGSGMCPTPTKPAPKEITWQGKSLGNQNYLGITGLARASSSIFAYGYDAGGLSDFQQPTLPSGASNIDFLVEVTDQRAVRAVGTIEACAPVSTLLNPSRIALNGGVPIVGGALATNTNDMPIAYAFNGGTNDACPTGNLTVTQNASMVSASIPFWAAFFNKPTLDPGDIDASDKGFAVGLDIAINPDVAVGMGIESGGVWGTSAPTGLRYFAQRTPATGATPREVTILNAIGDGAGFPSLQLSGGVALDGNDTVWVTGRDCPDGASCADRGTVFLSSWAKGPGEPVATMVTGDDRSFGAGVRYGGGHVVLGGGYRGNLTIGGVAIPRSLTVDPFVVALSPSGIVQWTYPSSTVKASFDTTNWEAISDLAVVGDATCGAVYITGCAGPLDPMQNCQGFLPGRHGFLAKLDLATGAEVWATEIFPDDKTNGLFSPTALAADATGVWVAALTTGSVSIPGLPSVPSGPDAVDPLVVRYGP